ncbi:hypothetical protein M413DRAFT_423520 [Hebeloma cylindrosporum]|uniref:Major facilitator superfamily (MFS) profile domain-containing protein n=1 Tax=Hebeloma cylindrosporum TaxID=76867 RepID=A0A0C3C0V6_HEBCY|nr:hypothetical protein M413DRAFT_423520 [Hebeloma cylindrosporum h7]
MENTVVLSDGTETATMTATHDRTQSPTPTPSLKLTQQFNSESSLSPASPPTRPLLNSCIIVLTVTAALCVNMANSTAMSISIPTLQKEMKLEPAQLQWMMAAYPLSSGCLFLACGRLADVYGRKKMFSIGSLLLAIFTLACAFPNDIITLDILRGIQGIGAAAMVPASFGILVQVFPPSRARSLAFATYAAGVPTGAVFGTVVGGVLTEYTAKTWRSSFYMLSGVCFMCFLGGLIYIDNDVPSEEVDKRIDWLGAFLATGGLVLIVFVLSQGELAPQGWATPYIIASLILGVVMIAMFLYWQHYLEQVHENPDSPHSVLTPPPLMKLSIWKRANGRIAAMMMIAFTNWCAFQAWTFWVQLYFQNYMAYTAVEAAIRLIPMFVWGIVCNLVVGFMAARIPLVWIIGIGAVGTTTACLLFAIIDPSTTYWAYAFVATVVSVMGPDLVFTAGTLFIAKFALPHEQSVAGALFNTMSQLGTAVGVTVSTVVSHSVGSKIGAGEDALPMYRAAQWTCFAFGIIETVLVILFFRGVGVVGHRTPKPASVSETEKGESRDSISGEHHVNGYDLNDQKGGLEKPNPSEKTIISVGVDAPEKDGNVIVTVAQAGDHILMLR